VLVDGLISDACTRPCWREFDIVALARRVQTCSVRDHKSLLAWQRAHSVARAVVDISREYWRPYAAAIFSQLQRSALSAQLNIAEGHALRSQRRFHNHLVIAYGSAVETIDLLEHVLESNLVPSDIGYPVLATAVETRRLLLGLMKRYG